MNGPDVTLKHPVPNFDQVVFLKNTVKSPNIIVGDYSYYDDPENPEDFERNVMYHFRDDRLVIGKFCAIARGVKFIMNGANHPLNGFSTYPFYIFGGGWEKTMPASEELPWKGDTIVGHDVWIGYGATIMPGVKIGHGSIIGTQAVVARDIPPYAIAAGNPATVVKQRFPDDTAHELLEIAWWDWPIEKISRNLAAIAGGDLQALRNAS